MKRQVIISTLATVMLLAGAAGAAWAASYGNPQFLVETDWLARHVNDRDLRIVDMRNNPEEYATGHIPGAVYVGVNQMRLAMKEPGFVVPPDYEIEELLGQLGITHETMVVVYDDLGGLNASRGPGLLRAQAPGLPGRPWLRPLLERVGQQREAAGRA